MCRLLGSVSRGAVTVDDVLGRDRGTFLGLANKHGDGWGHAWSNGASLDVRKAPDSALESAELAGLAADVPAEAAVTHLRWATLGLGVGTDNTHPFTDGNVAFAHNGSIDPPAGLDVLVPAELSALRRGDTDSERFFLALLARMTTEPTGAALATTVHDIVGSGVTVKSLNCMLLAPEALYAVCSYDPSSDEDPDYYPLLYRRTGDTVVVASTGWTDTAGWQTLSNGQMLVVDRESLAMSVVDVATPHDIVAQARR